MMKRYSRVLSIAGSDPSGGAGIQADIKAISATGSYAATAITAVVNENTVGVYGIHEVPVDFVVGQIESVLTDIGADAVKIGMLYSAELVQAVAETLKKHDVKNIVVDPVMVATSGDALMKSDIADALKAYLFPIARLITPNIPEAETLLGRKISTMDEMKDAADELSVDGLSVLVKGGHLSTNEMADILCDAEDEAFLDFPYDKIVTPNKHGTGCTLSSAIASYMAQGKGLLGAVTAAKQYIDAAIMAGAEYEIGKGHGPVCHFWKTL